MTPSASIDDTRDVSLIIDRSACAGHGLCYGAEPRLLDSDDQGDPVLVVDPVPVDLQPRLPAIINVCPERALSVSRPGGSELSRTSPL